MIAKNVHVAIEANNPLLARYMSLSTTEIWKKFYTDLYFFTLKKVKNIEATKDILQNSFAKIHANRNALRQETKVKPWVFQITRNEIANFHRTGKVPNRIPSVNTTSNNGPCCFDRFVDELPEIYKTVMLPIYFHGKKQTEVAKDLGISLPNVKARIRRAKIILKEQFIACCKYNLNKRGQLIGEPDCMICG